MERKIELLAPGGDVDSVKAAIVAGADAVFCGLNKFNARNRAANISLENLHGLLRLAHKNNCEVFLTLNILILEPEIPELIGLLNKLVNTGIDGVIVQDLGLFYLLNKHFETINIHASTQLTTHNKGQIHFLKKLNASRVNLSRELNIDEIAHLTEIAYTQNLLTEVFVHGSYCLSFSGICYMSSVHSGKSGNRGRCSQPCRDRYLTTPAGKDFPLNLKDNSAYFDFKELYNAGVASLKIEGRIKEFEYVYTVVSSWKKQIRGFFENDTLVNDSSELYKVFNRDFSNGFLKGRISKDMFIDNPMSNSTKYLSNLNNYSTIEKQQNDKLELYEEKEETRVEIREEIDGLSIEKIPLVITVFGKVGEPLKLKVETPNSSFNVPSEVNLAEKGTEVLTKKILLRRLKTVNETAYYIEHLELSGLDREVYLPFKELTSIKKKLLFVLNDSKEWISPIAFPKLKVQKREPIKPKLAVLISSEKDISFCDERNATIYFQLPNGLKMGYKKFVELFQKNTKLVPWFPSVMIGEDYDVATLFLQDVQPELIVANNTGIGYEACKKGIRWIAGPFLNLTNSYSLLCLKENFNCSGAFISNELNKTQIRNIKKPENFELFYSIYHPVVLMTSRQCLFHQVSSCTKNIVDNTCVQNCEKTSFITSLKDNTSFIEKSKGNYHNVYNQTNFLNTEIVVDMPNYFSGFLIDLRDIKTDTRIRVDKLGLIALFEKYIHGHLGAQAKLKNAIFLTSCIQYLKGI